MLYSCGRKRCPASPAPGPLVWTTSHFQKNETAPCDIVRVVPEQNTFGGLWNRLLHCACASPIDPALRTAVHYVLQPRIRGYPLRN